MSTATLENAHPGGARFTKIYDEDGNHIITRDEHKGLEWTAHALDSRHAAGFGNMLSRSGAKRFAAS